MVKYIESRPLLSTARHRHETTAAARTRAESSHGLSTRRRGLALLVVALIATVVVLVGFSAVHTPREGKTAGDNPNFLSTSMPLEADRPTQLEAAGYLRHGAQVSEMTGTRIREGSKKGERPSRSRTAGDKDEGRGTSAATSVKSKPNVFVVLIDDMGWSDIGYQGHDVRLLTPNLDKLAAGGIKLTNYYSASICTPARASLMTGRYPVRYGLQYSMISAGAPWGLPVAEKILPEYMNEAGYDSHMVGKWHLGMHRSDMLPHRRGFKTYLGYLSGEEEYWSHKNIEAMVDGNEFYDFGYGNATSFYNVASDVHPDVGMTVGDGQSAAALLSPHEISAPRAAAAAAADTFAGAAEGEEARFTNSAAVGPSSYITTESASDLVDGRDARPQDGYEYKFREEHDPAPGHVQRKVLDESTVNYAGVYSEDVILGRVTRILESKTPWDDDPLFLYVAHQAVHSPLQNPPTGAFTPEEKALLGKNWGTDARARFAAVLLYLDKKIGQFVRILEEGGWMDNSILVIASDNGGSRVAGGSPYPLRGYKATNYEGGSKVPAFVYSKSHIPLERRGTTYSGLMHVTDWLPTLASVIGFEVKGSRGKLDGVDQWQALIGAAPLEFSQPRTELLYSWDSYALASADRLTRDDDRTQAAFRQGKWKYLRNAFCQGYISDDPTIQDPLLDAANLCPAEVGVCPGENRDCLGLDDLAVTDWLFDLENDPREMNNVLAENPEIARRLRDRAREVALSEFTGSQFMPIDERSYRVWIDNGWWMTPWYTDDRRNYPW